VETYTLTVVVEGGTATVTPNSGTFYYAQIVDLTATVDSDYILTGWSGGTFNDASKATTNSVLITGDKTITVHLRQRQTYIVSSNAACMISVCD
jgi:hypothetical protein